MRRIIFFLGLSLFCSLITPSDATAGGGAAFGNVKGTATFRADKKYYPSSTSPNHLPDGTLVRATNNSEVYYIRRGKKSWVLPSIFQKWTTENHFYKSDIALRVSPADLAAYPQERSVNALYVGKVLKHPNGTQYFIDDKFRKRKLSPAVRGALKIPVGNLYATSDAHLREFSSGPDVTADRYPGGMVIYTGPWHGGKIWRIQESTPGKLTKHLYLSDYLYEAHYNPDESHRAAAIDVLLAKHERGANIERYPDGWVVGLGTDIFVVQGGALRKITSPGLFATLGYQQKYVLKVFPEFLQRYPRGEALAAFRTTIATEGAIKAGPQAASNTANNLQRVRPGIRTLIADVNTLYLAAYDADPTVAENQFWVDFVYNGEVSTKADLLTAMKRAKATGKKPVRTSRTTPIDIEQLKTKWFFYLFYFTHQREPDEGERDYWYSRINDSDRNTIEKLGGTIQWLKDTSGQSRK